MKMNIVVFVVITLTCFLSRIVCAVIYPVVFLFRHNILKYAEKRIEDNEYYHIFLVAPWVKKWKLYFSPLFWGFLFTTGLTDKYSGAEWYKKELKKKWFNDVDIESLINNRSRTVTFKQRLQYFWLCYLWGGLRNAAWAFMEWFFREGKADNGTIKVLKYNTIEELRPEIMPGAKFKDADGTIRNNSGPYIRYTFDSDDKWNVTNEGTKIITFITHKGNERFTYAKCKILKLDWLRKFLVIEMIYGWDNLDGGMFFHNKYIFKKMDEFAVNDYNKYVQYVKDSKNEEMGMP
jgi:hypothetical protein